MSARCLIDPFCFRKYRLFRQITTAKPTIFISGTLTNIYVTETICTKLSILLLLMFKSFYCLLINFWTSLCYSIDVQYRAVRVNQRTINAKVWQLKCSKVGMETCWRFSRSICCPGLKQILAHPCFHSPPLSEPLSMSKVDVPKPTD
jgi:hypothetical protein